MGPISQQERESYLDKDSLIFLLVYFLYIIFFFKKKMQDALLVRFLFKNDFFFLTAMQLPTPNFICFFSR
jgi:hypothetical protein